MYWLFEVLLHLTRKSPVAVPCNALKLYYGGCCVVQCLLMCRLLGMKCGVRLIAV